MTLYTPSQLLKPNVQSTLFADIVTAYKSVGKSEELGIKLVNRARLPSLCSDYGLIQDLRDDLREHDYFLHSQTSSDFARLVAINRKTFQMREIQNLNQRYLDSGGRLIFSGDDTLDGYVSAVQAGTRIVEGGRAVVSDHYGEIDPRQLNEGFDAFLFGEGQVRFMSALAVATERYDWNIGKLPTSFAQVGGNRRSQDWKVLPCDWRRARAIGQNPTAYEPGFEGYKLFAKLYADGDMKKAFVMASALLGSDFVRLGWGSCIQLHVDEVDAVQAKLKAALADLHSPLRNFEGYKTFAREKFCMGQMDKAFEIASALLGHDFVQLNWGKQIHLLVNRVDNMQAKLSAALEDQDSPLRNFEGYKTFAREKCCKGKMDRAFILASALLGDDFEKLNWGPAVPLHVDEVDAVQDKLKAALADPHSPLRNFDGYKTFAREKFCRENLKKAYQIASALLGDDFAQLKWGSQIPLHVDEVDAVQDKLKAALADPHSSLRNLDGYKTFARERYCKGNMSMAFQIASSLLGENFDQLNWGSCIHLQVDVVDAISRHLHQVVQEGASTGHSGFAAFVRLTHQKPYSSYLTASAIIGREAMKNLGWPNENEVLTLQKQLYGSANVGDHESDDAEEFIADNFPGDRQAA